MSNSDIQGCALIVLLGLGVAALMWRVLNAVWREHCPNITTLGKAACVVLLLAIAAVGGDKSPAARFLATFVTALRDGTLLDPSGKLGAAAQVAGAQTAASLSAGIVAAASATVTDSQALFEAAAYALTNPPITAAYLGADMPRALGGGYTNHNIAGNLFYARPDSSNLLAYVWFSQTPALEPRMVFAITSGAGVQDVLTPWTNSYPATVEHEGLPCVEYQIALPAHLHGIPLKPALDVTFGGTADEGLIVPDAGVAVATNGVECLPYTGTDVYSAHLSVTYKGGIATAAEYYGTNYSGIVNL